MGVSQIAERLTTFSAASAGTLALRHKTSRHHRLVIHLLSGRAHLFGVCGLHRRLDAVAAEGICPDAYLGWTISWTYSAGGISRW
jgi:hypothetical protein